MLIATRNKKLTNTNNSKTLMTQDVVLGGITTRPIRTTMSDFLGEIQGTLTVGFNVTLVVVYGENTTHFYLNIKNFMKRRKRRR